MKRKLILFSVSLFSASCLVPAQGTDTLAVSTLSKDSVSHTPVVDTAPAPAVPRPDSLSPAAAQSTAVKKADSLAGTRQPADTAAAKKQEQQKIWLVKRSHDSRQQVILAASMMIFVVSIMTLAQQWNPR